MTTEILIALLSLPNALPELGKDPKGARTADRPAPPISWWQERGYAESTESGAPSLESLMTAKALVRGATDRGISRRITMGGLESQGSSKKVS